LHPLAMRDLANREGRIEATVAACDDHALVGLDALAVALDDLDLHDHRVAGLEFRHFPRHALALERLDDIAHGSFPFSRARARSHRYSANSSRRCASSGAAPISSGRVNQVRPSASRRRQRSMAAWSPELNTAGTA